MSLLFQTYRIYSPLSRATFAKYFTQFSKNRGLAYSQEFLINFFLRSVINKVKIIIEISDSAYSQVSFMKL